MMLDLESYIGQYRDHAKISRLVHIVNHGTQEQREQAAVMALAELKKGMNTALYREVCAKCRGAVVPDEAWLAATDEKASKMQDKLERELSAARQNLIKESIRLGFNELGHFFMARGEYTNALKSYVRTRDHCQQSKHQIEMCLNSLQAALEMTPPNFQIMPQYLTKAEQHLQDKDKKEDGKLRVIGGLAHMSERKYRVAGRKFVDVPVELGNEYNNVVSASDIALYGALCALASFERPELKSKVLDNAVFKNYLELVPGLREIISDFYESRYTTCFAALQKLKDQALLDVYLFPHVNHLYDCIRERALKQYVHPFVSVDLRKMAAAFNSPLEKMERDVADLIMAGAIQARIDSHNKVLYAQRDNARLAAFDKCIGAGRDFVNTAEASMRRLNMLKSDFRVQKPTNSMPHHGGASNREMMGMGLY